MVGTVGTQGKCLTYRMSGSGPCDRSCELRVWVGSRIPQRGSGFVGSIFPRQLPRFRAGCRPAPRPVARRRSLAHAM